MANADVFVHTDKYDKGGGWGLHISYCMEQKADLAEELNLCSPLKGLTVPC